MIYLVHVPSIQLCKVGCAKNVAMRLRTGEAFIPGPYEVAAVRDGGLKLEKAIHRAASQFHVHGEWFREFRAVMKIFTTVDFVADDPSGLIRVSALDRYLGEENLSCAQFAEKVGNVSISGVIKWLRGERLPRPRQMQRIFEITQGRVTADDFYDLEYRSSVNHQ